MLLLLFAAARISAAPVTISVQIDPPVALPGVPVSLILDVENTSNKPQVIPSRVLLLVRASEGEAFVPSTVGASVQPFPEEYRDQRTIPPGETRRYEVPVANDLTAGAMMDPRLWNPGKYDFQLILRDDLRDTDIERFGLNALFSGRASDALITPPATLQVEKPAGTDAEIWSLLLEKTGGRGMLRNDDRQSDAIARELWNRAANSPYRPYLIAYMRYLPHDELIIKWREIVEKYPSHRVAETIRLGDAQVKALEVEKALTQGGDLEEILARAEQARNQFQALAATDSRHDLVRVRARRELGKLRSREEMVAAYRERATRQ
jgi:hypothetical protein